MLSNKVAKVILKITVLQNLNEEDLNHTLFFLSSKFFFVFFFCWDQPNNVDSNVEAEYKRTLDTFKKKKKLEGVRGAQ